MIFGFDYRRSSKKCTSVACLGNWRFVASRLRLRRHLPSIIKGNILEKYYSDILVEGVLVIELKCVERLANEHMAQGLNYLRASGRSVCLLVNFQRPKAEWRRIVNGYQPAETAENAPNLPADHQ